MYESGLFGIVKDSDSRRFHYEIYKNAWNRQRLCICGLYEKETERSDRHFGIGSDGLILIGSSDRADFRMNIYNADGSQAEMCGNGIRCVAKYVYDYGLTDKDEISVDTLAGIKYLKLTIENGKVSKVRVNMGKPILKASEIPVKAEKEPVVAEAIEAGGREWKMTCVSMGNPHAVIFIDTPVKEFPLETYGPLFEIHERFPKRTNTEFFRVLDRKSMEM